MPHFHISKYITISDLVQGFLMTTSKQQAMLNYLEFRLVNLVDLLEDKIDPISHQFIVEEAYDILNDFDDAFTLKELSSLTDN